MSESGFTLTMDTVTWTVTCMQCGGEVIVELLPVDPYILIEARQRHPCFAASYTNSDRAWVQRMLEGRLIWDE